MNLFVIIPVHNRREYTKECILSLKEQTVKNFNIIIVNDGSTDGTEIMIQKEFPEIILINGDGSLWWTASINVGISYALEKAADYILTLNDDTIAEKDFIEKMMKWAAKCPNSILGAFALDIYSKAPIYGGERGLWIKGKKLLNILDENEQKGLHWVTHFPGRGLLVPSIVFNKIGFFDEKNFPQTIADYDFTIRAIKASFAIYCNYDAKIYIRKEESSSVKLREVRTFRNYIMHLFSRKGGGNLIYFTKFIFKNCPTYLIPYNLLYGYLSRILGYTKQYNNKLK